MTVKEQRKHLIGPQDKLSITVCYENEEYEITEPSPVLDAFGDYIVEDVSARQPFQYTIFLKRAYLKQGEEGEVIA